jgi:hypothetical protein
MVSYKNIINPSNGEKVSISSKQGKLILNKYLNILNGGSTNIHTLTELGEDPQTPKFVPFSGQGRTLGSSAARVPPSLEEAYEADLIERGPAADAALRRRLGINQKLTLKLDPDKLNEKIQEE